MRKLRICQRILIICAMCAAGCTVARGGLGFDDNDPPPPRAGCEPACENGGVCVETECDCSGLDFEGPACATPIDDCSAVDCQRGTCVDGAQEYACDCEEGWTVDAAGLCTVEVVDCNTPMACVEGACDDSGESVVCTCNPGYSGTNCNVRAACGGPPDAPSNSAVTDITGTAYLDTVTYACLAGYENASVTILCQADWTWEPPVLDCMPRDCGPPPVPPAAARVESYTGTSVGDMASYACLSGYTGTGANTAFCQPDGMWSALSLVCAPFDCSENAAQCVHGDCQTEGPWGTPFCDCDQGWRGIACDIDIDECDGGFGPCNPYGTIECINQPGDYECVCDSHHDGPDCWQQD